MQNARMTRTELLTAQCTALEPSAPRFAAFFCVYYAISMRTIKSSSTFIITQSSLTTELRLFRRTMVRDRAFGSRLGGIAVSKV